MKEIKVSIDEDYIKELERADYEASMAKSNAEFMLEKRGEETGFIGSTLWKGLCEERMESARRFDRLKKEAEEKYVPAFLMGHEVNWSISYAKNEMTINVLCECGEKLCQENMMI